MIRRWTLAAGTAALLGCLVVGLLVGGHRSAVDWGRVRALCLASDDWGLAGFLPDSTTIEHLDREALAPGGVMDVYWHSTLEDSATCAAVGAVLAARRGRDGLPAVLQPNYILASLAYTPAGADSPATWRELEWPAVPPGYERPGLWAAVRDLQAAGLWHPELHGRWHYDPDLRRERTAASPAAQAAAARQILPFPGAESAWELGPWRDPAVVAAELDRTLEQFTDLFGHPPRSVIAPDYRWGDEHERLWVSRGLRVIQGQRQQRQASWQGTGGRARKILHRAWTRWSRPDRVYLDRNCLFEPVQLPDPAAAVRAGRGEVLAAWGRREPAILQTHRINVVHLDATVRARGLGALAALLDGLAAQRPVFLVDAEVADLRRRGTSWVVRGERLVVRNYARSRRLVVVPAAAWQAIGGEGAAGPLVLALAPGEVRTFGPAALR